LSFSILEHEKEKNKNAPASRNPACDAMPSPQQTQKIAAQEAAVVSNGLGDFPKIFIVGFLSQGWNQIERNEKGVLAHPITHTMPGHWNLGTTTRQLAP